VGLISPAKIINTALNSLKQFLMTILLSLINAALGILMNFM